MGWKASPGVKGIMLRVRAMQCMEGEWLHWFLFRFYTCCVETTSELLLVKNEEASKSCLVSSATALIGRGFLRLGFLSCDTCEIPWI